jgi:hypothetical protein
MELRVLLVVLPACALAQVSNVSTSGFSAQQYVLNYTTGAPGSSCTVDAFTDSIMSQEVNDTNTAVYANANVDTSRFPENAGLANRHFIIGTRKAVRSAATQYWTSLSLQAETQYWYRVTCGTDYTGTFITTTVPGGTGAYNENLPADPNAPNYTYFNPGGWYAYPEFTNWTNDGGAGRQAANLETIIDPQSGILLKKFTQPGEAPQGGGNGLFYFFPSPAVGANWSTANCGGISLTSCLSTDDANYASYSGTTQDRLYLHDNSNIGQQTNTYASFDSVEFSVKAWAATGSGANAQISVCMTTNGVNCFPTAALAKIVTIQLSNVQTLLTGGSRTHFMLSDWVPAGYNIPEEIELFGRGGTADVDASGNVTLATTAERQGQRFYSNWTNGSIIHITNSDCAITSVTSPQALTINLSSCVPALTTGLGLAWGADTFGFLVWKTTASTDQINLQYVYWTSYVSKRPGWASSGLAGYCSMKVTTRPSNGHTGFHCATRSDGSSWLYWVDNITGEAVPLGQFNNCLNGDCYSGSDQWFEYQGVLTTSVPIVDDGAGGENYYTSTVDNLGYDIVIKCNFTSTNEPNNITGHCYNLVPHSKGLSIEALVQSFTAGQTHPAFDSNRFNNCSAGQFILANQVLGGTCAMPNGEQNQMHWYTIYDPNKVCTGPGCAGSISAGTPGAIIAAVSSFGSGGPFRWGGSHGFFYCGFNCTKGMPTPYNLLGGGIPGSGPYGVSLTSGNITATPAHPCGPAQYPCTITPSNADPNYPHNAAVTVTGYDDWVVSGEPCNPNPLGGTGNGFANGGTGEPFVNCPYHTGWDYLVQAEVGDIACVNFDGANCQELVYISAKPDSTHWTVARGFGFRGGPYALGGTTSDPAWIRMYPKGDYDWKYNAATGAMVWDFVNDPHGQAAYSWPPYDHASQRSHVSIGDTTDPTFYLQDPQASYGANFNDVSLYPDSWSSFPHFQNTFSPADYAEVCQPHLSYNNEPNADPIAFDVKPCWFFSSGSSGNATNPSGHLFKFTSTSTDGDNLTHLSGAASTDVIARKLVTTMAIAGNQPLIDISGQNSVIDGTSAHNWHYCVARRAGECVATPASAMGDIYVNWPYPYVFDVGGVGPAPNPPNNCTNGDSNCGITFTNTGFNTNNVSEIKFIPGGTTYGRLSRIVTFGLVRYRMQNSQGNVHTLPDHSWVIVQGSASLGQWSDQPWLLAKLPSEPLPDGFDRTNFIPTAVSVAAGQLPGGTTNVISRFGYAENGTTTQGFCTSRQEECIANYSGAVPTVPFSFPTDGSPTTEAGVAGLACVSGCTLTIPAVPQRVLYHQEVYRNASNAVLGTSNWTATIPDTLQVGLTTSTTVRGMTVAGAAVR